MSRIINHVVSALEILQSSFRVAQAVESRLAPNRGDLRILGIDPAAFAQVTRGQRAGGVAARGGRSTGFAHA